MRICFFFLFLFLSVYVKWRGKGDVGKGGLYVIDDKLKMFQ